MSFCSACGAIAKDDARFCATCGQPLPADPDATVATPISGTSGSAASSPRATPPSAGVSRPPTSSTPLPDGTYEPGMLVADRYRVVAMLGKGGMGEVYRADDLKLGQSVALKFLPEGMTHNADSRARFHNEVRTAREIAHPNVCRVYDIGDVDGRAYLTMEYIDGEDLSSLLRRIGRLPEEKAVEIARQLCAGLGALHDRGVLHRDLKPANVMIDGRGRVRITDFGLSGIATEFVGAEARAGTPAYMAPEQLAGERADERSDIYALGLILYEVFTGKRAFEADSIADLSRLQRETTPTSPSAILPDLDPATERVLTRCLEADPERRPPSAFAVAAALPGGDPLAAALAAGEVPSIEMVAAAGSVGRIRPALAWACVAATALGIILYATVVATMRLDHWDPLSKPAPVLVDRAREILAHVGWEAPVDEMHSFGRAGDVLRWIAKNDSTPQRWERLRDRQPSGIRFWYRSSPSHLIPRSSDALLSFTDPPQDVGGMVRLRLDSSGRLVFLEGLPRQMDPDSLESDAGLPESETADNVASAIADWDYLIAAAGLDPEQLEPTEPRWLPATYADDRRAWTGTLPKDPDTEIRVEGASLAGVPVFFELVGPWTVPERLPRSQSHGAELAIEALLILALLAILGGLVTLAVRNVRSGRGDQRGARRLSLFVFGLVLTSWTLMANHTTGPSDELNMFFDFLAQAVLVAGLFWGTYLALEPYVRRTWPKRIVGWSRVLTGQWRDSLVGRDILMGGVFFLALMAVDAGDVWILQLLSVPSDMPTMLDGNTLLGVGPILAMLINVMINAMFNAMFFLLVLLLLRMLFRRQSIAVAVFLLLFILFAYSKGPDGAKAAYGAWGLVSGILWTTVLLRFGLLVFVVGFFFRVLVNGFPITLDSSAWFAGTGYFIMFVIMATTLLGLWLALSGDRRAEE